MARSIVLAILVALLPACSDPVQSHLVDSLGGETPGVPKGPLHRPGQPCLACHGHYGPADTEFSLAGTVYQDLTSQTPLVDAIVHLVDSNKTEFKAGVNCAGNFFVLKDDFNPTFPVGASIQYGTIMGMPYIKSMDSPIYREGSCAICHAGDGNSYTTAHIYLSDVPLPVPPSTTSCK
jgi:hypothetical protein